MLRVKQENKSDQRPEGMISGYDVIEYTVGMTFYCTNNCTTSLKLKSIKGHYDYCGLNSKTRKDKKEGNNKTCLVCVCLVCVCLVCVCLVCVCLVCVCLVCVCLVCVCVWCVCVWCVCVWCVCVWCVCV